MNLLDRHIQQSERLLYLEMLARIVGLSIKIEKDGIQSSFSHPRQIYSNAGTACDIGALAEVAAEVKLAIDEVDMRIHHERVTMQACGAFRQALGRRK